MSGLMDNSVRIYIEARVGETRVSTQRVVTLRSFKELRDNAGTDLFALSVDLIQQELQPYVKVLVSEHLHMKEPVNDIP
jgi:hypothetical protein